MQQTRTEIRDAARDARAWVAVLMRRLSVLLLLLAGCASSSEFVPGPPSTVREPTLSPTAPPIYQTPTARPLLDEPVVPRTAIPPREIDSGGGFLGWLQNRRGWTWGAANRGPVRDAELDRLMVDTLGNPSPGYSREPSSPAALPPGDSWLFPPGR